MKARYAAQLAAAAALLALPSGLTDFWIFITIEVLAFALYAVSFNVLLGYGGNAVLRSRRLFRRRAATRRRSS